MVRLVGSTGSATPFVGRIRPAAQRTETRPGRQGGATNRRYENLKKLDRFAQVFFIVKRRSRKRSLGLVSIIIII